MATPVLTYSATTFAEATANDGSISTSITITLADDTFAADLTGKIVATNLPTGLTAAFVRTSGTVVTATLTGTASSHANTNGIANLTFTFQDGAFVTTATAAGVTGYAKSDLVIDFADPAAAPAGTLKINALSAAIGKTLPELTGTATGKDAEVHVFNGTKDLGKAVVAADGTWKFTVPATVKDGKASFTAKEATTTGTKISFGSASTAVEYTLDTKLPTAPTVNALKLPINAAQKLTGKAEKDATVEVFAGTKSLGTATADAKGVWELAVAVKPAVVVPTGPDTTAPTLVSAETSIDGKVVLTYSEALNATTAAKTAFAVTVAGAAATVDSAVVNGKTVVLTLSAAITAGQAVTVAYTAPAVEDPATATNAAIQDTAGNDAAAIAAATPVANKVGETPPVVAEDKALTDGEHEITAVATDAAGNAGAKSKVVKLIVDTKIDAPTITTVIAATTKVATQKLEGKTEAGAKVMVYGGSDGTKALLAKEIVAGKDGTWKASVKLEDATHKITVKATDVAGNKSVASDVKTVTIDTKAPDVPTVDAATVTTAAKALPTTLTGKAEKGASVEVFAGSVSLGKATADASTGAWTLTPAPAKDLKDGVQKITAKATDAALNVSKASAAVNYTIDNKGPAAPTVTALKLPISAAQKLTGKAEKDATVEVFAGTKSLGTATADAKGVWELAVAVKPAVVVPTDPDTTAPTLVSAETSADGKVVVLTYNEALNATTAAKAAFEVKVAGAAATVDSAVVNGKTVVLTLSAAITAGQAVTVAYTAPAVEDPATATNAAIQDTAGNDAAAIAAATPVANKVGETPPVVAEDKALTDGEHEITAVATDAAGNAGAKSKVVKLIVDTKIDAPTITTVIAATTKVATQKLEGKTEAGAKVQIYGGTDGNTALGKPIVAGKDGTWKASVKLEDATHKLTVKATDVAGNVSVASAVKTVTIDTATTVPTLELVKTGDALTGLKGKAEAGATVKITVGTAKDKFMATADASGNWEVTDVSGFTVTKESKLKITAIATDEAKNVSKASGAVEHTFKAAEAVSTTPTAGNDTLTGTAGDDTIDGLGGNDTLTGGAGNDTFKVTLGTDTITDLTTGDILQVSSGATAIANNVTAFVATAGTSNAGTATLNAAAAGGNISVALATGTKGFTLTGGAGADTLTGSAKDDIIHGGAGANTITGGAGNDTITLTKTNSAIDTVVFAATAATNGVDAITGFTFGAGGDVLNVSAFIGATLAASLNVKTGDSIDASALNVLGLTNLGTPIASNFGATANSSTVQTVANQKLFVVADDTGDGAHSQKLYFVETNGSNVATVTLVGTIDEGALNAANFVTAV